jgi:hypothetical protein
MGAALAWGCVDAPQINCLAPPVLNSIKSDTNADAVWTQAGADEGLRQALERAAYSLEDSATVTYRGVNPSQRLTREFDGKEARLNHPRAGSLISIRPNRSLRAQGSFFMQPVMGRLRPKQEAF